MNVWTLAIALLTWLISTSGTLQSLYLATDNGAAAHYAAIQCPRQLTVGPAVQLVYIPSRRISHWVSRISRTAKGRILNSMN